MAGAGIVGHDHEHLYIVHRDIAKIGGRARRQFADEIRGIHVGFLYRAVDQITERIDENLEAGDMRRL